MNIARLIRVQLKTGFIREAPLAYLFLQRYPPVVRQSKPPIEKIKTETLPFMRLYDKVVERDAIYADERVYPAFWQHEPQAMVLAKKQHQLMRNGLDENTAYVRAMRYVEELESAAFEEAEEISAMLKTKGASVSFAADEELADAITYWRERLCDIRFSKLREAEKGEIDHLIQSKVLKWNEVERERRMQDPIFFQQFDELRAAIFPEIAAEVNAAKMEDISKQRKIFKNELFNRYHVNETQLSPATFFFYEDYQFYFNKLKKEPKLMNWNEGDRSVFFRWIVNTLAVRDVLKNSSPSRVQHYLEDVRSKFFPMVKYPEKVNSYNLPELQDVKASLYKNDVGYRKQNDKLYIRRFYRLPALLFPEETSEPHRSYKSGSSFVSPLGSKNLINKSVEQIRRELESSSMAKDKKALSVDELLQQSINDDTSDEDSDEDSSPSSKKSKAKVAAVSGKKKASVEDLLDGYDDNTSPSAASSDKKTKNMPKIISAEDAVSKHKIPLQLSKRQRELLAKQDVPELSQLLESVDIQPLSEEEDLRDSCLTLIKTLRKVEQRRAIYSVIGTPAVEVIKPEEDFFEEIYHLDLVKLQKLHTMLADVSILGRVSTAQERQLMVEKYNPSEKTKLERIREEFLSNATRTSYDDCVTQSDFESVYQSRQEFLILERADMNVQYEEREGSRRAVEWKERGLISAAKLNRNSFPLMKYE